MDFTVSDAQIYPEGTSVSVYNRDDIPDGHNGAPVGSAVDTATVTSGVLTFEDLTPSTRYVAAGLVGSNWRYLTFITNAQPPEELNVRDYGAMGDGASDDSTAFNAAIADLNVASFRTLVIPPGDYRINAAITEITRTNTAVRGSGPGSTKIIQTGGNGTFFSVGARWVTISDLSVECDGSPGDEAAFVLTTAGDFTIRNVLVHDVAAVIETGTTGACPRLRMENVHGVVREDSASTWYVIKEASGSNIIANHINADTPTHIPTTLINGGITLPQATITVDDTTDFPTSGSVFINGDEVTYTGKTATTFTGCTGGTEVVPDNCTVYGGADTSAYMRIEATDTLNVTDCVLFTQPGTDGVVGKPRGLEIVATPDSTNNLYFTHNTLDGTHFHGIRYSGDADVDTARNYSFIGNRFETAAGKCVVMNHTNAGGQVAEGFTFIGNLFNYGNEDVETQVPFQFVGNDLLNLSLIGNKIQEKNVTGTRANVFGMNCGRWTAIGNSVRKNSTATDLDVNYVFATANNVTSFVCALNHCSTPNTDFFNHFAYSAYSSKRRVIGNIPTEDSPSVSAAATLDPPVGEYQFLRISGSTNIDEITPTFAGHTFTMKFGGTPTVAASATLKLAGGANFSATADDTLTIICDGSVWYEIARSVNA